MKEHLSAKERWLAVLAGQKPDRIPLDYWTTPEADRQLKEYLGCASDAELFARLHIDKPLAVGPAYIGPPIPAGFDIYGCAYRTVDYGTGAYGECVSHPLAKYSNVEEIAENYSWPSLDWYDFSGLAGQLVGQEDRPVVGGGSEPLLIYKNLRGQEQAMLDLILNPEIVDYCLEQLFGLAYETTARIFEMIPGQVTYSYVAEDMGSEQDLMFSPEHIRRFLLPHMQKMTDLVHSAGAYVFHHNDGAIRKILPDLVKMGIDILNPIQWRCPGMAREELKRDFGQDLVFHGGMDNQYTLPFGSVAEVRQEVEDNIRILGAGGGYILAPCHNIQPVNPPENTVAMYETALELGWQ